MFTSSSFVASNDASRLGDDGDEVAITYEVRRLERCTVVSVPDFSSAETENTWEYQEYTCRELTNSSAKEYKLRNGQKRPNTVCILSEMYNKLHYYVACVCSRCKTCSDWLILGHFSPSQMFGLHGKISNLCLAVLTSLLRSQHSEVSV